MPNGPQEEVRMSGTQNPVICAVVGRTRHKMMQAEIQQAAKHGAKLIELRLDFLAKPPDYHRLLANKPCPTGVCNFGLRERVDS